VYLDFATANDSLRSVFDLATLVPLFRVTAFGRAIVDLELCFALFAVAAWISLWLDRPEREHRSLAELVATFGALVGAAAVLIVPGAAGHAGQTSPRGLTLLFDWLHLASGSVWLGGLIGLLVFWRAWRPADGRRAGGRRAPLLERCAGVGGLAGGTGIGETIEHMPAVNALWETGFGQAILVKTGLLGAATLIASGNLLRSKPRLVAPETSLSSARLRQLLRTLISGEVVVVVGIVLRRRSSRASRRPAAFALRTPHWRRSGQVASRRPCTRGIRAAVLVSPNKAVAPDSFALRITKGGQPVRGANVTLTFKPTEMQMPQQEYQLTEIRPGCTRARLPHS